MNCTRRLLPLLVALCLAGCPDKTQGLDAGAPDAGPKVLAEQEPNGGPDTALPITSSAIVEANLGADPAKPDEDWYALSAALPSTVELLLSCPPGADVALEVVDASRAVLTTVNSAGVDGAERMPNLSVSGKVLVRVVGAKKGAGGAYTLRANFRERQPGFEAEPNERRVDATSVPLGAAISGYLGHAGDEDWYRYELPLPEGAAPEAPPAATDADGGAPEAVGDAGPADAGASPAELEGPRIALRVELSAIEGVASELSVLTEAEAVLFSAKGRESAPLALRNVGVRQSDRVIYVVVKSAWQGKGKDARRGFNSGSYYTLTVAAEDGAGANEFEPNDDLAHATPLSRDSYREGFLSPKGDVDVYHLTTGEKAIAKVQVSGVERVDLVLSLVAAGEKDKEVVLLTANEGGVKEPEQLNNVACDQGCDLRVESAARKVDGKWSKDDENGDQAYRLSVTVSPDDGSEEVEPNTDAARANPLEWNRPVRGTIYPKKDVDFFALDLRQRPVKTPLKATLLGILKVDVGLYLHRVDEAGKLTLVQTADGAKGDKPEVLRASLEAGLYVFEVRDTKGREANHQDSYQLTVEEAGD